MAFRSSRGAMSPVVINAIPDPRLAELRRLSILVSVFVVTPALLLLTVGILVLIFAKESRDLVFGVVILCLVFTMIAGIAATYAYIMHEATLAKLQADFVSKVSHDLRTPLTSIRMFVETLQLGRAPEPELRQQCLDVLATETARLSMMIDQLLGWARMEAGKRVYHPDICQVPEIVNAAIAAFEPQCLTHPVQLDREVPTGLPSILADRDAMIEVLLSLLQNAHRYTGERKHIAVRCDYVAGGECVTIRVDDNGPGIAKREQSRIFEKFYRAEDPLKRDLQGTGLGLAIVKHIVHGNRGTITVASEVGVGSSFCVTLPVAS